jgi:hypothetical protein
VWWDVKEARKLKKGIVSREAVEKANPIIQRLIIHAVWASLRSLKAGDKRPKPPPRPPPEEAGR